MAEEQNSTIPQKAIVAESHLLTLKKNLSTMRTPDCIDVPDARLNCCAILAQMTAALADLASACKGDPESVGPSLLHLTTQIEAIKRDADDLATKIMTVWPPPLNAWFQQIYIMERCFLKIREILKIPQEPIPPPTVSISPKPGQPPPPDEETTKFRMESDQTPPKGPAKKIQDPEEPERVPEMTEHPTPDITISPKPAQPLLPKKEIPKSLPGPDQTIPKEPPKKIQDPEEASAPEMVEPPAPDKTISRESAHPLPPEEETTASQTEPDRTAPQEPPEKIKKLEETPKSTSEEGKSAEAIPPLPDLTESKPTAPEPNSSSPDLTVPPQEDKSTTARNAADRTEKLKTREERPALFPPRPDLTKKSNPSRADRANPPASPQQPPRLPPFLIHQAAKKHSDRTSQIPPETVPGPAAKQSQTEHPEPQQTPKPTSSNENDQRDFASEILRSLTADIVMKIERLEILLKGPKEENLLKITDLFEDLQKKIRIMSEQEQDLQAVLPEGFQPQAGSLGERLSRLEEACRAAKEAAVSPFEKAAPEHTSAPEVPKPSEPPAAIHDPGPKCPAPEKAEKEPPAKIGRPKKTAPPPEKLKGTLFWEAVFYSLKIFVFFVLIALLLIGGSWILREHLRPVVSDPAARKPPPAAQPKETIPSAFEPFLRDHAKSVEKRSLALMVFYLYKNPDPAVRRSIVSMLRKWPWKGIPEVLLEVGTSDPDGSTVQEAMLSFQKITGYTAPGRALPEEAKAWWQEHKTEIEPQLEDAE